MAAKTLHGSCACNRLRYQVTIDLEAGSFKCNCSVCTKLRSWFVVVSPDDFRLLVEEKDIGQTGELVRRRFCRRCGVHCFARAVDPRGEPFVGVVLSTLDDVAPEELAAVPVEFIDGRNNRFESRPAFTAHL